MATSSSTLRYWWSIYKCNPGIMVPCTFFGKNIGTVPLVTIPAYAALEQALRNTGYYPYSRWAYNCRNVNLPSGPTNTPSLHSYGIAVDIDPSDNRYSSGSPWAGKFTKVHIDEVYKIKTKKNGKTVWAWGGYWYTPDRMHFQIDVRPDDLSEGVVYEGIPIYQEDDDMFVKQGDKGPKVEYWQRVMLRINPSSLPRYGADGDYGAETANAVASLAGGNGLQIGPVEAEVLGYKHAPVAAASTVDQTARNSAASATSLATSANQAAVRANTRLDSLKASI